MVLMLDSNSLHATPLRQVSEYSLDSSFQEQTLQSASDESRHRQIKDGHIYTNSTRLNQCCLV